MSECHNENIVLTALIDRGPIVCDEGRAVALLEELVCEYDPCGMPISTLRATLSNLDWSGSIARDVAGRRTFSIEVTNTGRDVCALHPGIERASGERIVSSEWLETHKRRLATVESRADTERTKREREGREYRARIERLETELRALRAKIERVGNLDGELLSVERALRAIG